MINTLLLAIQEYAWSIALLHLALAIILFFIVNWIGAKSVSVGYMQMNIVIQEDSAPAFNFLFKVLAPVVYLILCAVAFQEIGLGCLVYNSYFIVIDYWCFRLLWILFTSRGALTNWSTQILYWICSIGLAIWIYSIIENVDKILPDPRSLLDQMWILIIAFIYSVFNKVEMSRQGTIKRKNNYIKSRYKKFHKAYDNLINGFFHNDFYEALTYSIMIYEDFNRPRIVRWIEYFRFWITKKPHTLGIMQVMTDKYINDNESVKLAIQKIAHDNNQRLEQEVPEWCQENMSWWVKQYILEQYNGGDSKYVDEVSEIFDLISNEFYLGNLPTTFSIISENYD